MHMKEFTSDEVDAVAGAYFDTFRSLSVLPGVRVEQAPRGTLLVVSGMLAPMSNGVCSPHRAAVPEEVAALAPAVLATGLPWSILCRGEPERSVLEAAAAHGLTGRVELPLMAVDRTGLRVRGALEGRTGNGGVHGDDGTVVVRRGGADLHERYISVLTQGFGMGLDTLGPMGRPEVLEIPGWSWHLVEADGQPVACGAALVSGGHVVIGDITTLPAHRGRGYGRLVTEAAIAGGLAAGAHTACLLASPEGLPLYRSMGFRTAETWTYLVAEGDEEA